MLSFSKATFPKCSHFLSLVSVTAMCPALSSYVKGQEKCAITGSPKRVELSQLYKSPNYPYYAKKPRGNIQVTLLLLCLVIWITF